MLGVLSAVMLGNVALGTLVAANVAAGTGWETFASDLTVGVITTGGLGLLLWYFTHKIERDAEYRNAQHAARLRWSVIGRRVGTIVNTETFADDTTDASNLGPVAHDLISLLQDEPLAEWQDVLKSDEIKSLVFALDRLETTVGLGKELNSTITFSYTVTTRLSRLPREKFQEMLIAETLGLDWRTLPGALGVTFEEMADVETDLAAMRTSAVAEKMAAYALSRRDAEHRVEQLKTRVDRVSASAS